MRKNRPDSEINDEQNDTATEEAASEPVEDAVKAFEEIAEQEETADSETESEQNDTILNAANEVIKQYQTSGATPYFFIVDQEGIRSYSKENTDKEIIHTIKELL